MLTLYSKNWETWGAVGKTEAKMSLVFFVFRCAQLSTNKTNISHPFDLTCLYNISLFFSWHPLLQLFWMCTVSAFLLRNLLLLQPPLCFSIWAEAVDDCPFSWLSAIPLWLSACHSDHSWGLRRLSCKIRLFPWLPWFFREVCHGNLAHRSLNRPKICFPTVQDCNSAGDLALFAYSLLLSLHLLHCHQPLPPQMDLLCLSVGFARLLVKQENASPAGSLITCEVIFNPLQIFCSVHSWTAAGTALFACEWVRTVI